MPISGVDAGAYHYYNVTSTVLSGEVVFSTSMIFSLVQGGWLPLKCLDASAGYERGKLHVDER
jgi:hypothetical protein